MEKFLTVLTFHVCISSEIIHYNEFQSSCIYPMFYSQTSANFDCQFLVGNVSTALGPMSEKEFQKVYNIPKPTEETEIIFYCMIGKRSGMAQQNTINLGYKK